MKKKQTAVEWLRIQLEIRSGITEISVDLKTFDKLIDQAKQMEIEQAIDLLTKYHDNLFYIPLKEGEAENIYNHLNTIENDTNVRGRDTQPPKRVNRSTV